MMSKNRNWKSPAAVNKVLAKFFQPAHLYSERCIQNAVFRMLYSEFRGDRMAALTTVPLTGMILAGMILTGMILTVGSAASD